MEHQVNDRWVLAFDASCEQCRLISETVQRVSGPKLEVLSLGRPDVQDWRKQALGDQATWRPTLIRVRGERVTAWTHAAMGIKLVRLLGPRSTIRLLRALGELPKVDEAAVSATGQNGIGRKEFLRIGAGIGIAAGLLFSNAKPALAESRSEEIRAWIRAHKAALPTEYDELIKYPMDYRKAIYAELSPKEKSTLWLTQISRYREAHPGLSAEQRKVLDLAQNLFSSPSMFAKSGLTLADPEHHELDSLARSATTAFGAAQTTAILATLGPTVPQAVPNAKYPCGCSTVSPVDCGGDRCVKGSCYWQTGCGVAYMYICNGLCFE